MTGFRTEDHVALAAAVDHLGKALQGLPPVPDLAEEDFQILDRVLGLYRKLRIVERVLGVYLQDGTIRWPTNNRKIAAGELKS